MAAGTRIHHCGASRPIPMKMPSRKPRMIDGMARRTVPPTNFPKPKKPWTIRKGRLRQMTSRSSIIETRAPGLSPARLAPVSSLTSAGGDQAGDRDASFDPAHDRRERHAEHEIDQGPRGERL